MIWLFKSTVMSSNCFKKINMKINDGIKIK